MSRTGTLLLATAASLGLLFAAGFLDVQVSWRGNSAQAIDLFGKGDAEEATPSAPAGEAGTFWQEGSGQEPVVPRGVPASFADLAERVSQGVVNIQTSRTISGAGLPQSFEEFFFGGPFGARRRFRARCCCVALGRDILGAWCATSSSPPSSPVSARSRPRRPRRGASR